MRRHPSIAAPQTSCRISSSFPRASLARVVDLDGAYDLHVHSAPDLFPRIADDREMVAHAARQGFAGVVMKNHFEGTASRAKLAGDVAGALKVYGSLVLNRYVGGITRAP